MLLVAFYWLTVKLYATALRIASLFSPKARLFIKGRKNLLSKIKSDLANDSRPRIWMHCASLGEFEQGRPVLEELRKQYPGYALVLTFFSPSGYEVRKNYDGADHVFYLPTDSPQHARQFLDALQPKLCIFVKYELWYYYLHEIAARNIPLVLISARFRKGQVFFKRSGVLHRKMLRYMNEIFVQDKDSLQWLHLINIKNCRVSGDTRFDRVIEAAKEKITLPVADAFCKGHKILVAGSTWKEDEQFLKKALSQLASDWKMILVPHEVDAKHIEEIEKLFEGETIRWSGWKDGADKRILIVDTVGLLLQLYHYGQLAWIGGGFGSEGVHNVLEAAVYGMPCAYGPTYYQFLEAKELIEAGGAVSVKEPEQFLKQIAKWEADNFSKAGQAAKNNVFQKAGATKIVMDYLAEKKILSRL